MYKPMTTQELINYYKNEITRFKKEGGIGAELNIPVLQAEIARLEK